MKKQSKIELFKIIGIVFLIFFFVFLAVYTLFFFNPKPKVTQVESGTGTGFNDQISADEQKRLDESYNITALTKLTPYVGKNFNLYYSFGKNEYVLYIPKNKETEGNKEFVSFLKDHGVTDASKIDNLIKVSVAPANLEP